MHQLLALLLADDDITELGLFLASVAVLGAILAGLAG